MGNQADAGGLRGYDDSLEIFQFQIKSHPEHHQADGGIDDKKPLRVKIEPDLINRCCVHTHLLNQEKAEPKKISRRDAETLREVLYTACCLLPTAYYLLLPYA